VQPAAAVEQPSAPAEQPAAAQPAAPASTLPAQLTPAEQAPGASLFPARTMPPVPQLPPQTLPAPTPLEQAAPAPGLPLVSPQFVTQGPEQPPEKAPAKAPETLPSPRPAEPFLPGRVRLPFLKGETCTTGTEPRPSAKELEQFNKYVQQFVDPKNTLDLFVGRSRLLILKEAPRRVQVGDEKVAKYAVVSPTELIIQGLEGGTTVLNLWFTDPKDKDKQTILSYLVRVFPDPERRARLERVYKALQDELNHAFPDSHVCLFLVGDKVVLTGQARDVAEATEILRIVQANAPQQPGKGGGGQGSLSQLPLASIQPVVGPGGVVAPGIRNYQLPSAPNIINLLRIPGEQQVMLRVTVAEINRTAARSIGVNFNIMNNNGVTVFSNNTGNLFSNGAGAFGSSGSGGGIGGTGGGVGGGTGSGFGSVVSNLSAASANGNIMAIISALRNLNFARSLAEPNLVALNGQTAAFQAGGQFPVPVVTGFTSAGLQGVNFVPFGVLLSFTPYITDRDRIRLALAAEVSTLNLGSQTTVGTTNVPGLNTRNIQTVVELREGQTLAVAGLIQNNFSTSSTRVPWFGDLPIIGRLAAFDTNAYGEQELVVLVTPELVHPLEHKEIPQLPGSDLFEPGDLEFYLLGRLESRRPYDYRSSVMTDIDRMRAYRRCERVYIFGPHGHTNPPADQ
jgi:pilus assembly protein CpaC